MLWHKIINSVSEFINRETKYYAQKAIDEILNKNPDEIKSEGEQ